MTISPLHCLTYDGSPLPHIEQVKLFLGLGANWIQLRQKKAAESEKTQTAALAANLCKKHNAVLIINDSPRICLESGASGVHLGLGDCPVLEARKMLGSGAIIGGTANTPQQAKQRKAEGCDYIGLGPWRFTKTKETLSEVLGESGIERVVGLNLKVPIIAIGGIVLQDVERVLSLGVHGIAVSSGALEILKDGRFLLCQKHRPANRQQNRL